MGAQSTQLTGLVGLEAAPQSCNFCSSSSARTTTTRGADSSGRECKALTDTKHSTSHPISVARAEASAIYVQTLTFHCLLGPAQRGFFLVRFGRLQGRLRRLRVKLKAGLGFGIIFGRLIRGRVRRGHTGSAELQLSLELLPASVAWYTPEASAIVKSTCKRSRTG